MSSFSEKHGFFLLLMYLLFFDQHLVGVLSFIDLDFYEIIAP